MLGLKTLDGVLNPAHVNGKHIVHNVFSVNKAGIVVLENKAGMLHWFPELLLLFVVETCCMIIIHLFCLHF